jgi:hypothetical protein
MSAYTCKLSKAGVRLYYLGTTRVRKDSIPSDVLNRLDCPEVEKSGPVEERAKAKKPVPGKVAMERGMQPSTGTEKGVEKSRAPDAPTRGTSPPRSPRVPFRKVPKKSPPRYQSPPKVDSPPRPAVSLGQYMKQGKRKVKPYRMRQEEPEVVSPPSPVRITDEEPPLQTPVRTWKVPLRGSPAKRKVVLGGERPKSPPDRSPVRKGGTSRRGGSVPRDYDWLLYYWELYRNLNRVTRADVVDFESEYGRRYPYDDRERILTNVKEDV